MHESDTSSISNTAPRFRFSLWSLFAFTTLLCMFLATPGVMLAVTALVASTSLAAIVFNVCIQRPIDLLMDCWSARKRRSYRECENDLVAMARDERFRERRTLFQPPSLMS